MEIFMSVLPHPKAPGAGAAKVTGSLSIVFAILCFPVGLVLAIVALVQHNKARGAQAANPEGFQPVTSVGLVTGVLGLVLAVLMFLVVVSVGAVAIPTFYRYREQAQGLVVARNLETAVISAEQAVRELLARAPGQIPSQDAVIRALASDPAILSLRNPYTGSTPALQLGTSGPLGTVLVVADREETNGVTTWSIRFRAQVRKEGQEQTLQREVITHTEEHIQNHTEDGWQVVQPPVETLPPVEAPPPVPAQPSAEAPPPVPVPPPPKS
jgi:type II secretory pathway pseudopilin PulG